MNWESFGAIAEVVSAIGVIISLVYLARQIGMSNRMARAEAYRMPNSDLNAMNANFSNIPAFNAGIRKVINGAKRQDLDEEEKSVVDAYLVSITNIYNQLTREIREGILPGDAYKNFGARGLLKSDYFRDSWPIYRRYLGITFVEEFETMFDLDPDLETSW